MRGVVPIFRYSERHLKAARYPLVHCWPPPVLLSSPECLAAGGVCLLEIVVETGGCTQTGNKWAEYNRKLHDFIFTIKALRCLLLPFLFINKNNRLSVLKCNTQFNPDYKDNVRNSNVRPIKTGTVKNVPFLKHPWNPEHHTHVRGHSSAALTASWLQGYSGTRTLGMLDDHLRVCVWVCHNVWVNVRALGRTVTGIWDKQSSFNLNQSSPALVSSGPQGSS